MDSSGSVSCASSTTNLVRDLPRRWSRVLVDGSAATSIATYRRTTSCCPDPTGQRRVIRSGRPRAAQGSRSR
jgi:hypothetical protein